MDFRKVLISVVLIVWASFFAKGQSIKGFLIDSQTKEPVPFANVAIKGKFKGAVSNFNGIFNLMVVSPKDSVSISCIGYYPLTICAKDIKNSPIELRQQSFAIKEIKVKPGINQAHIILKSIHKKRNRLNPNNLVNYSSKEYTKTTIVFSNIHSRLKNNWFFKKAERSLIRQKDSSFILPVLITEENHFRKVDKMGKEEKTLTAEKKNGIGIFENASIKDITDAMIENTNFYNNYISFLGKYFPSPIGKSSLFFYKMYITDSTETPKGLIYKIQYKPKNKKDLAFKGHFWVDKKTLSITEIEAELPKRANINFIRALSVKNDYQQLNDSVWFYRRKETKLMFDYNPSSDSLDHVTVNAKKIRIYNNLKINPVENSIPDYTENLEQLLPSSSPFKVERPEQLDIYEQGINNSITELKKNPYIVVFNKLTNMALNGYYEAGRIDFGPYLDWYGKNEIEGHRLSFGIRTNKHMFNNQSIGGYLGYGFGDKKWKYGITYLQKFNSLSYNKLTIKYWDDITKIGHNNNLALIRENSYGRGEDNIVSSIFAIEPNKYLSRRRHSSISFENDIRLGISQRLSVLYSTVWDSKHINFLTDNGKVNSFNFGEVSYTIRFAFKEKYLDEYFHRIYLGNKHPVVNLKFSAGQYDLGGKTNQYFKFHSSIKHRVNLGIGYLRYMIESGIVLGKVPFPLLEIHRGNQTYGMARYSFNMLNYMEYASDRYLNFHGSYQMNGFIFNRIPLIKKLNLRETASFKAIIGEMKNNHNEIIKLPDGLTNPSNPYMEAGIGISNLFKIGRIEYVWRLTDTNKPDIQKSGVRIRFEISF